MRAFGGISIVNAIPSWLGGTMAVDLRVNCDIIEDRGRCASSELVKAIVEHFSDILGANTCFSVKSEIPSGGGLKSSSAVAVAIIEAIKVKYGLEVDVPRLASQISLKAGVSVTGAFDDACAAYFGGVCLTDNRRFKILRIREPPEGVTVVILGKGGRRGVDVKALRRHRLLFKEIFRLAVKGYVIEAAGLNGVAIGEILGYDLKPVEKARKAGALASGITGNGPSVFAITREGEEGPIIDMFSEFGEPVVVRPISVDWGKVREYRGRSR